MFKRAHKFLPEDFAVLLEKIAELEAKLIECGQALGESTEQSSETWHDNATYDVARMNFEITACELQKLMEVRNSAQIIEPAPDLTEAVILGSLVTVLNEKTGEKQRVKITGDTISTRQNS
ncbi:MAG: hypothetical protein NTV48_00215 [Candidatus Vogelbacteria bacterium]|nr:hypothetical protein [Candidatus Vogelbacteria bacterium]